MRTKQSLRVASMAMLGATALTLTTLGAPAQAMRSSDVGNAGTNYNQFTSGQSARASQMWTAYRA
jgi:hypothetical protein